MIRLFFKNILANKRNKAVVLVVSTIVLCCIYGIARKAINDYNFNNNDEIITNSEVYGLVEEKFDVKKDEAALEENENLEVNKDDLDEEINFVTEEIGDNNKKDNNISKGKIYIHVTGEVNNPGVVILNYGSRIADAINAAGGTTAKADVNKVNLVYILEDGMKINIPNGEDLKNNPNFEYITKSSGDGREDLENVQNNVDHNFEVSSDGKNSIVNINTATQTELETLPGIGPSLALKIINYRKENGNFSSIEDIKNVSGIGEAKYEELKKYITV